MAREKAAMNAHFNAAEHANFIAAKAIAIATAYLDGRSDGPLLGRNACHLNGELMATAGDVDANRILEPVRLLVRVMSNAAISEDEARRDLWELLMGGLVELVRHESTELRKSGAQRS
jgi:hypothetical protein